MKLGFVDILITEQNQYLYVLVCRDPCWQHMFCHATICTNTPQSPQDLFGNMWLDLCGFSPQFDSEHGEKVGAPFIFVCSSNWNTLGRCVVSSALVKLRELNLLIQRSPNTVLESWIHRCSKLGGQDENGGTKWKTGICSWQRRGEETWPWSLTFN